MVKIKSIEEHAGDLRNLLVFGTDYLLENEHWFQILDNLKVVSGICSLEYDALRFDQQLGWCEPHDTMAVHQDDLEQKLILELARFHFLWAAIEKTIDICVKQNLLKKPRGKVNNACYFIKCETEGNYSIDFTAYRNELSSLKMLLNSDAYFIDIYKEIEVGKHVNLYGAGLFLAYKLRNKLAHGSLSLPITAQEDEEHNDYKIVLSLSRLLLYTIQLFAIIDLSKSLPTLEIDYEPVPIDYALTHVQYHIDLVHFNVGHEQHAPPT